MATIWYHKLWSIGGMTPCNMVGGARRWKVVQAYSTVHIPNNCVTHVPLVSGWHITKTTWVKKHLANLVYIHQVSHNLWFRLFVHMHKVGAQVADCRAKQGASDGFMIWCGLIKSSLLARTTCPPTILLPSNKAASESGGVIHRMKSKKLGAKFYRNTFISTYSLSIQFFDTSATSGCWARWLEDRVDSFVRGNNRRYILLRNMDW